MENETIMNIVICGPGGGEHEDYALGDLLGIESQIYGLAGGFRKHGHDTYILRRWYGANLSEELDNGAVVVNVASRDFRDGNFKRILTKMNFSRDARKEAVRLQPNLVIMTDLYSSVFLSPIRSSNVFVTHNPPSFLSPVEPPHKALLKRCVEIATFSNCDVIVALNRAIQENLQSRGYHTIYIPNGVDIDKYPSNAQDEGFILCGGRLENIKGLDILIRAYSGLDPLKRKELRLVIVGYGPEKGNLKRMVSDLELIGDVDFVPWLPKTEFIQKLSKCSIFALPSLYECMPVSVLEAMACGKPVIASNIPGPNDIIQNHHSGLLFDCGNAEHLRRSIEELLIDKRHRSNTGRRAREAVEQGYTFDKIATLYEEIFRE
jgi:glycosyltransferase involved in cell wall biosynthesis